MSKNIFKKILYILTGLTAIFVIGFFTQEKLIAESTETTQFNINIIPAPECYDGIDNDGDGLIDYPNDPDCTSYTDNDESPDISVPPPSQGGIKGGSGYMPKPPQSNITFSGLSYPLSKVTILKDGEIATQVVAGTDAQFKASLSNLTPGNYNFMIKSTDSFGNDSNPFSFPIFISKFTTVDVTGIFLAPTININKYQAKKGKNLVVFGQTAPNSNVFIELNSKKPIFAQVKSDANGVYFYNLNSNNLDYGKYNIKSKTSLASGKSSNYNVGVNFGIAAIDILNPEEEKNCYADLNNDGRVNLIDFSIALPWHNKTLSGNIIEKEKKCLSGDGIINLTDFSIMAFYWTG